MSPPENTGVYTATADVCSFSRLLVYDYATARNGVCDDVSLSGNAGLKRLQKTLEYT